MKKKTENPFKFGDPVEGGYYLPRPELEQTVSGFLENRIHVVLIGPRRFGKTSFVWRVLHDLEKKGYLCLFLDVFSITSHRDFLRELTSALSTKKHWVQKFLEALSKIKPKLSHDLDLDSGSSSLSLTLDHVSDGDVKFLIQEALQKIGAIKSKVILAIDEFQQVGSLEDDGWLEATLRTLKQQLKNTSFLFTGSRKSIIYDMLNNRSRPFYRSCQSIEFPPLGPSFTDWIVKRFREADIACEPSAIENLREKVQDTPHYVQMVCFHLVASGYKRVTSKEIEAVLQDVVLQNSYAYQTLLSTLSPLQQRALRLAAHEGAKMFSKEHLLRYEIRSTSALTSALRALKDKGILEAEGHARGIVTFEDPLLALWLQRP